MECYKCNKSAVIDLKYLQPLCNKCFCEVIERRIRKYTRINQAFKRGDRLLIIDELCYNLVKKIIDKLPVIISPNKVRRYRRPQNPEKVLWLTIYMKNFTIQEVFKSSEKLKRYVKKNNINKIVIPWTIDDSSAYFLHKVFNNFLLNEKRKYNLVKLLSGITNTEAQIYSSIKGVPFKPNNLYPDIQIFLDSLEHIYPDTKFGLVKSKEVISKLIFRENE